MKKLMLLFVILLAMGDCLSAQTADTKKYYKKDRLQNDTIILHHLEDDLPDDTIIVPPADIKEDYYNKRYLKEAERILNVILNSPQFDSIYSSKQVYFVANELLPTTSTLVLKRGKYRAKIVEREELKKKGIAYVCLADFTTDPENPIAARVQISSILTMKTLTLRIEKKNNKWIIVGHVIWDEY